VNFKGIDFCPLIFLAFYMALPEAFSSFS